MNFSISINTDTREGMYDITELVKKRVKECNKGSGIVNIYARGATAGIMIQENWDNSVQQDVMDFLRKMIPQGVWLHDVQDGNGDSHIKSGIVGPSETVPFCNGELLLSTWQNIFFCEFDGPRENREIILTVIGDK